MSARNELITDDLIDEYSKLLVTHITSVFKCSDKPLQEICIFSERLAGMEVQARDVVTLHLSALQKVTANMVAEQEKGFSRKARFLLIEVLGTVMDSYRKRLTEKEKR